MSKREWLHFAKLEGDGDVADQSGNSIGTFRYSISEYKEFLNERTHSGISSIPSGLEKMEGQIDHKFTPLETFTLTLEDGRRVNFRQDASGHFFFLI